MTKQIWRHHAPIALAYNFYKKHVGKKQKPKKPKVIKIPQALEYGFSQTETMKSKTETLHGNDITGGFTSYNGLVRAGKPKKGVLWKGGKATWLEAINGISKNDAGARAVQQLFDIGTTSQWLISSGTANPLFGTGEGCVAYFDQNSYRAATGSQFFPTAIRPATDKLYLSTVAAKVQVVNLASIPVTVHIYACVSIRDHNSSPRGAWVEGLDIESQNKSGVTQPGPGGIAGGSAGGLNITTVGVSPGDSPYFKKLWKVVKVHRLNLAAAATEDCHFHVSMNQIGDAGKLIQLNPDMNPNPASWTSANITCQYPRGSVSFFAVVVGAPVKDFTTDGNLVCTFGSTEVGFIIEKVHRFKYMKDNAARMITTTGYSQIPANTLLEKQGFVTTQGVLADMNGESTNFAGGLR